MAWTVEFADQFEGWWNGLSEDEQIDIDAKVRLLEELGAGVGQASCRYCAGIAPRQHEGASDSARGSSL